VALFIFNNIMTSLACFLFQLREMLLTRDALLQQREQLQRQIADGVRAIKTAKESKRGAKQSRLRSSTRTGA